MISAAAVYAAAAFGYAAAAFGFGAWLRRVPAAKRRYCYPVVGVVVVAAVTTALSAAGIGVVQVNGSELDVPSLLDDLVAYSVLWPIAAMLAGASRRTVAVAAVVPAVQVLAFNAAPIAGGAVGLAGLLVLVAGYVLHGYLFLGRIWDRAADVPDEQRLLHWKARNLLLFLIGMLISLALLSLTDVFDTFVAAVIAEHLGLLIRVGFAGFLFVNVDAVGSGPAAASRGPSAEASPGAAD